VSNLYLLAAFPLLLLVIWTEWRVGLRLGRRLYSGASGFISNLNCGVGQAILDVFFNGAVHLLYIGVQAGLDIAVRPRDMLQFVLVFVLIDFLYYLFHRLSHAVPFLWAIHSVHHQAEEFNFSVGLRLPFFFRPAALPIYLIPALLGFDPLLYIAANSLHAVLQLFSHTRLVRGRLPWISWLLVTPSHHRVHHGCDALYRDRNFSGVFSVWDYAFGSFQPERHEPRYGVEPSLRSWDAWEANVSPLRDLFRRAARQPTWRARARVLLRHDPQDAPSANLPALEDRAPARPWIAFYALFLTAFSAYWGLASQLSLLWRLALGTALLTTIAWIGRRLDEKSFGSEQPAYRMRA
jgi:sterol desaturase/sphingolipid hydroxylase (fatty acid hydroxylase superfamily)